MGFNSAFKGLNRALMLDDTHTYKVWRHVAGY